MRPEECLAIHSGETRVPGVDATVSITRDAWGIPHIRAESMRDAFFAQGFCMAQDRGWQIELIRHMALGASASLLNRGLLGVDKQSRMLGYGRLAAQEWPHQTAEAQLVLGAYAAGVNAAIETQPVPFEFRSINHQMAPWSPVDSLAIIKMVNMGQQWASKLKLGQASALLGTETAAALVPEVPEGSSLIVPSGSSWAGSPHPFREDITRAMGEPDGPIPAGGGSNCWIFHGSKTATGAPLVAGDPHLRMSLPGQWYVVHMECPEFTTAGPCNPGYPGPLFYGHNTNVAWTMTHAQGDRWDNYRERIRQSPNGPEALYKDEWAPLERIDEHFDIRDGAPENSTIWLTRHGPVVSGDPEKDDEVISTRWGLAEPAHDIDAVIAMLRAKNADDAQAAIRTYDSVSGNFCFADTNGDIQYQYSGRIPKRPGWLVPVPGWDGEHEWQGDVPKDELPSQRNPDSGYLLTANNRTTTPDYPHYLTSVATPFRADRLRELLKDANNVTPSDVARWQHDQTSIPAREFAKALDNAAPETEGGRAIQAMFTDWDGHLAANSSVAVALNGVLDVLGARTVRAYFDAAPTLPPLLAPEERRILFEQLRQASDLMLPGTSSWASEIATALDTAAKSLAAKHGDDRDAWRWDKAHWLQWRHNLGRSGDLADVLNIPPVPVGGDSNTPFAASADSSGRVTAGVSYRQIFDLSDLNAAQICIPPGNSGQPGSPHYADNVERWRDVEYHPLFINWDDIEANSEAHLTLLPG